MQSLFQIEIIYKPAKDETIIFSRSAPSRRKEVPFEPDKTPVPADLYFSGGRQQHRHSNAANQPRRDHIGRRGRTGRGGRPC